MQINCHKNFGDSFAHSPLHCCRPPPLGDRRGDRPPPSGRCAPLWPGPVIGQTLSHSSATIGQPDLALRAQAPRHGDGRLDGLRPDPAGLPHQGDLRRGLDHPHVMEDGPEDCGK